MATLPEARGQGAGTRLLDALVRHAEAEGATLVWCNARTRAISLYDRAGFEVVSDVFEPPHIGPHVRMERRPFRGFPPEAFAWFDGLARDNSKAYFTATRERYEIDVRGALLAMLEELSATFGGEPRVFRQQRDLRFTADRTPYKTRTYGVLERVADTAAGVYAELSARGLYARDGLLPHGTRPARALSGRRGRRRRRGRGARARRRRGAGGRARARGPVPPDGAARRRARPPADRAAAPHLAVRGPPGLGRARHRPRGRTRARGRDVARRGAAQRVARPSRRAEHGAAGAARPAALTRTGSGTAGRCGDHASRRRSRSGSSMDWARTSS